MLNTISVTTMMRIINQFLSVIVIHEKMVEEIILQENNE
jgi:hypothetical protein